MDTKPFVIDFPFQKAASPTGELALKGYASTWIEDRDNEVVDRGAFANMREYLGTNPILLWQHDPQRPIGTVKAARIDDTGLHVEASVPKPEDKEPDWSHLAYNKIRKGIVRTFSVGGVFHKSFEQGKRRIKKVDWAETSVVSIPANPGSFFEASIKSFDSRLRPELVSTVVGQMEQLLGMKMISDPELVVMTTEELVERYEELAGVYRRSGRIPPNLDAFDLVVKQVRASRENGGPPDRKTIAGNASAVVEAMRLVRGEVLDEGAFREELMIGMAESASKLADGIEALLGLEGKAMAEGTETSGGVLVGKTKKRPPNLREATDPDRSCGTCTHFADGKCDLYGGWGVDSDDTCDSWKGAEEKAWREQLHPRDSQGQFTDKPGVGGLGDKPILSETRQQQFERRQQLEPIKERDAAARALVREQQEERESTGTVTARLQSASSGARFPSRQQRTIEQALDDRSSYLGDFGDRDLGADRPGAESAVSDALAAVRSGRPLSNDQLSTIDQALDDRRIYLGDYGESELGADEMAKADRDITEAQDAVQAELKRRTSGGTMPNVTSDLTYGGEPLTERLPKMKLDEISDLIKRDWDKPNYAAAPYIDAMRYLGSVDDNFGADSGRDVAARFLSNSSSWRGPTAKLVKAELRKRLGLKR